MRFISVVLSLLTVEVARFVSILHIYLSISDCFITLLLLFSPLNWWQRLTTFFIHELNKIVNTCSFLYLRKSHGFTLVMKIILYLNIIFDSVASQFCSKKPQTNPCSFHFRLLVRFLCIWGKVLLTGTGSLVESGHFHQIPCS